MRFPCRRFFGLSPPSLGICHFSAFAIRRQLNKMAEWAVVTSKSKKKDSSSQSAPPPSSYVLPAGHNPLGTKNEPCRYFALGTCAKGDACHFSHPTKTKNGYRLSSASPATAASGTSRSAAVTTTAAVPLSPATSVSTTSATAHSTTTTFAPPAIVGHSKATHTPSTSETSKLSAAAAPWVPAPVVPAAVLAPAPEPPSDDLDDEEFYFYGAPGMAPSAHPQPPSLSSFDYPPLAGSLGSFGPRFFNSALSTLPTTGLHVAAAEEDQGLPEPSSSPLRWLDDIESPTSVHAQAIHEGGSTSSDPSDDSLNCVALGVSNAFGGHGMMIRPKPTATMAAATASTATTATAPAATAAFMSFAQIAGLRLTGPATVAAATVLAPEPIVVQVRKPCPFFRQGNCQFGKGICLFCVFLFFLLSDRFRCSLAHLHPFIISWSRACVCWILPFLLLVNKLFVHHVADDC
jgi:hypothetical protein